MKIGYTFFGEFFTQGTKGTCTPFSEKSYEKMVQKKDYRKSPLCALSALSNQMHNLLEQKRVVGKGFL